MEKLPTNLDASPTPTLKVILHVRDSLLVREELTIEARGPDPDKNIRDISRTHANSIGLAVPIRVALSKGRRT